MPTAPPSIRAARTSEPEALRAIEAAADQQFAEVGPAAVAAHPPLPVDAYDRYCHHGRSWVAVGDDDRPVALLVAGLVDGNAHVDEVSVHPSCARRGIGAVLIDHLGAWATARGLPAVTPTTFEDVPWSAPYYGRCGFHRLDDDALVPELAAIRRDERARFGGLHPRVAMIRTL